MEDEPTQMPRAAGAAVPSDGVAGASAGAPVPSHPVADAKAPPGLDPQQAAKAAELIQRNYRGYRTRRQLSGWRVDGVAKKWAKVSREAQWQHSQHPESRQRKPPNIGTSTNERRRKSQKPGGSSFARGEWKRVAAIARQARNDDSSESESDDDRPEGKGAAREERRKQREEYAEMMGLQYFLELVDEKHRYGSHLRTYHAEWMKADTNENFFYWLDHGDGRDVEAAACTREVLERDQVRYLSREERLKYLVKIDAQGRLRWAKNDERITTSYAYRDSLEGIVPSSSKVPAFREGINGTRPQQQDPARSSSPSLSSLDDADSTKEGQHYVNPELDSASGAKKVQHISAAAVLNRLLQNTTKKNTWIFATDKQFRLYVGIKQSGAFQHSSFLRGGRLSAAGVIKVKDGQLRSLSPLSGHYRPPTRNFRAFVKHMSGAGVDMSRVSISKSYAVLLGLEGYVKTKKSTKSGIAKVKRKTERVLDPEAAQQREEKEMDTSQSARREKEHLERMAQEEQQRRSQESLIQRVRRKLSIGGGRTDVDAKKGS